jgi:hypothetical protein
MTNDQISMSNEFPTTKNDSEFVLRHSLDIRHS